MTRLVVTGASGFIGSRIVEAALARNYEVVALVRNPSAMSSKMREGLVVKRWQLGDPLPELGGAKALVHLAAYIPPDFAHPKHAGSCFEINVLGAMDVAAQAADQAIEKFVHFSSGQIYSTEQKTAPEQTSAYPLGRATYYLASKLAGELCVQSVANRRGLETIIFRLASIYGPGMNPKGMLPRFVQRLSAQEVVHLVEGGTYHVDFTYVEDVIDVTFAALSSSATGIFNVGSGEATTSLEAAKVIAHILGSDPSLIQVDGQTKESGFAALDVTKARETFGFRPKGLREGISDWLGKRKQTQSSFAMTLHDT